MKYRTLGRTGVMVSELCLGVMAFGRKVQEQAEANEIVDSFVEAGGNFFNTANVYGFGLSEQMLGEATRKKRDRLIIATSVHRQMDETDPNSWGNHRRNIISSCEASLRRLNTDYIDLYQIHRPQSDIPIDETLRALDDLIRTGKVRYIGTSTFAAWQVIEALWAANSLGLNRFVTEQPPYNLLDRRAERELIPACVTYGLGLLLWSPLAEGRLTGKYVRGKTWPSQAKLSPDNFSNETWRAVEALETLCVEKGCTLSAFSLAWLLSMPGVTSPIIGPSNLAQLRDNLGYSSTHITDDDKQKVDEIIPPETYVEDYYSPDKYTPFNGASDFGPHLHRW